jgi:uncharacterized caspase-like protein
MKKNAFVFLALTLLMAWPAHAQTPALRSALVIGLSQYGPNTGAATLEGVPHDMESAKRIAMAMGIPGNQIRMLRDQDATKENILKEIRQLGERTQEGGRSFIYFSGHGTRYWDPTANGCVEGLLTHDGQAITNAELAQATQKVTSGADKVITMIDACHSGGVSSNKAGTRSIGGIEFKPKFSFKASSAADACSQPSNLKTRSLLGVKPRAWGPCRKTWFKSPLHARTRSALTSPAKVDSPPKVCVTACWARPQTRMARARYRLQRSSNAHKPSLNNGSKASKT